MNILLIAPLPPPINGQTKASKAVLDGLVQSGNRVRTINLGKKPVRGLGRNLYRIAELSLVFIQLLYKSWNNDRIYMSLSESLGGNLKDQLIYLILLPFHHRVYVHMLGGEGMRKILADNTILSRTNRFFIRRFKGVFVEGQINKDAFGKVIGYEKVHIIPNFADEYLFEEIQKINEKFDSLSPIHILYLSNMLYGKGYLELAKAFLQLEESVQRKFKLTFVGGFRTNETEQEFLGLIKGEDRITYLGKFIDGEAKKALYLTTHIFCLPTYYPFEGQPISILEAYASGCTVITTPHSGIPYVFKDKLNGYQVEKQSVESLIRVFREIAVDPSKLKSYALYNRNQAYQLYRVSEFQKALASIIQAP